MQYIITFSAVILGFLIALFLKPQKKKNIKLLLAFSGAFLLSLTVLHLLPELFSEGHNHVHNGEEIHASLPVGIFIMIGILFQILLEFFSKGAEHGHVHVHTDEHNELHHIPWLLFISLCIHALAEGFPVGHHHDLAMGIAIHHLPIAIILTTFFINANLNKKAIFLFMITFAIMTPLGTILSDYLPILNVYYNEITAIVIGILFHISSTIIFESSEGHKFNIAKISMIVLGFALAYFI